MRCGHLRSLHSPVFLISSPFFVTCLDLMESSQSYQLRMLCVSKNTATGVLKPQLIMENEDEDNDECCKSSKKDQPSSAKSG